MADKKDKKISPEKEYGLKKLAAGKELEHEKHHEKHAGKGEWSRQQPEQESKHEKKSGGERLHEKQEKKPKW